MRPFNQKVLARCSLVPLLVLAMTLASGAQEWIGVRPRVLHWTRSGSADRVRLGVRTEGFYAVTVSEVATAAGLSNSVVSSAFQNTNVTLSCQGAQVACFIQGDTLVFKGMPAVARVPENVYWLALNTNLPPLLLPPLITSTNEWELVTTTLQGTSMVSYLTMGTLTNLPSYLALSLLGAGKSFNVTNSWTNGITQAVDGELSVMLLSTADDDSPADQHGARVSLNNVVLGTNSWTKEAYQTFTHTVPGYLLTNGIAEVKVDNIVASPNTPARFFWTKLALTVAHQTTQQPQIFQPSIRGVRDTDGYSADNVADYVVLIPPEGWVEGFRTTLQPLVDLRRKQGLRTAVLDVEALYNRFTYGIADPEAIRSFCHAAYNAPEVKLRYLLLAGSGSLDFAHEKFAVTNYQACLLPPLIMAQRFSTGEAMIVAADQAFGDVTGNAAPEISVGRFPTAWTQELAVAVAKTLAYEEALPWKSKAALSAGSAFTNDMEIVKGPLITAGKTVTAYYPATSVTWKNLLKPAFLSGLGSFWFIGHSDTTYFKDSETASDNLMDTAVLKTNSWSKMPVAILMGCHLNRWQAMNVTKPAEAAFGPFSVFLSGCGFSAVIASTGYAWDGESGVLGEAQRLALYLSQCSGSNGIYRIGDALCAAEQRLAVYDPQVNTNLNPHWDPGSITVERLQSYSLVGDPAMMWRHDYAATGTSVSWLLSHGFTAADGDVSDSDGDGWLAWQEYQAGTRPDTNRLYLVSQSLESERGRLGLTFEAKANGRYRVLWKSSLGGSESWTPSTWAWAGANGEPRQASELIVPSGPLSTLEIPLPPEQPQGFFKIEQLE